MKTMQTIELKNKRVLIREDLNVPLENGRITSDARIKAALPTIQEALKKGAAVMLMSHLGRPVEGDSAEKYSLAPVAERLSQLLDKPVALKKDWLQGVEVNSGEIVLLENVRFQTGEKANDPELAKKIAKLCDVFVMDAFATAHRKQASTYGVAEFAPQACAGPLLTQEVNALRQAMESPAKPLVAIVGGSKVSTKLTVLSSLIEKVDQLIVGGGIANTFIAAVGHNVGSSLYEPELLEKTRQLIELASSRGASIPIPSDVVVASTYAKDAQAVVKAVDQVQKGEMILDIGPQTAALYAEQLKDAGTIIWNGPVGVFEWDQFGQGTKALAQAIADSNAFSIAGGGDTLAAIDKYGIRQQLSYISTGGGAFLEYLEGKMLPAIEILQS